MFSLRICLVRAIGLIALPCAVGCSASADDVDVAASTLFAPAGEVAAPAAKAGGVSILAVCGNGVQSNGELCFLPESSVMTGLSSVYGVEVGYLNAGTHLDFAASSFGDDRLRIGLGNGAGGLSGSFTYVTGDQPLDVAVGDMNADGLRDIITADYGADQARARWNTGTNWNDWSQWTVDDGPRKIAVADFNGDGYRDFATLNSLGDTITVRLRNPAGGFFAGTNYAGATGYALAVADCDGDSDPDLIYGADDETVRVRRNNGAGAFGGQLSTLVDTEFGASVHAITSGDWNEDSDVDLMVSLGGDELVRLLGDGDCTFSGVVAEELPIPGLTSLATADMDDDGHQDVVMSNLSGELGIILGVGNGNFVGPTEIGIGDWSYSLATGDMNEDGTPDILVGSVSDIYLLESNP